MNNSIKAYKQNIDNVEQDRATAQSCIAAYFDRWEEPTSNHDYMPLTKRETTKGRLNLRDYHVGIAKEVQGLMQGGQRASDGRIRDITDQLEHHMELTRSTLCFIDDMRNYEKACVNISRMGRALQKQEKALERVNKRQKVMEDTRKIETTASLETEIRLGFA